MNSQLQISNIDDLQGVSTKELNMYDLHELYVDGVHVGYVRVKESIVFVMVHHKFTETFFGNYYYVPFETLVDMIERYRMTKVLKP